MTSELVFRGESLLGEGASWDAATGRLWWVDILGRQLMCGDPSTGATETVETDTEIGASAPLAGGGRALVLRDRVERHSATGAERLIWQGSEPVTNRFNDAAVDHNGALWISSMDFDAAANSGMLWRLESGGRATKMLAGYKVLNGPAFSPDGRRLYLGDTMEGRVLAFDLDPDAGTIIGGPFLHVELGPFGGLCDGMTVDAEGCLWVARITAGRISRYRPDGSPDLTIRLPVPMPTSLAFGGPDLCTLYVTTARILMGPADLAAYPESGSVFAVRVGTAGLKSNIFRA